MNTVLAVRAKRRSGRDQKISKPFDTLPVVTVQAPIFNEKFVVKRVIDALAALDYPRERLQIQIIDDSTDETARIAAECIAGYRNTGIDIVHFRRKTRAGFKAGALQAAMASAKGEFIAIFDADFVPPTDFLKVMINEFVDPSVAMAQARWRYLNQEKSLLTRVQAILLDAHFAVEQRARSGHGVFFNFNGTAGVWRRAAIDDAGGWRADTLTEDLDLSYRAQLRGWTFVYRDDVGAPSELPQTMRAFKSQQHRWAKGAIEVMRRVVRPVLRSNRSLHQKAEALFHLTGNISYLVLLIDLAVFLPLSFLVRSHHGGALITGLDVILLCFASVSHLIFFAAGQERAARSWFRTATDLPALLLVSIGLTVNNGRAVLEALAGKRSAFIRTPKSGEAATGPEGHSTGSKYTLASNWRGAFVEGVLAVFYVGMAVAALLAQKLVVFAFLLLIAHGYAAMRFHDFFLRNGGGWRRLAINERTQTRPCGHRKRRLCTPACAQTMPASP